MQAEGYPAGELKHGPMRWSRLGYSAGSAGDVRQERSGFGAALSEDAATDARYERARRNNFFHDDGRRRRGRKSKPYSVAVPCVDEFLLPLLEVVPLQLFAYFTAVLNGVNVDAPRNLVKAVVTE